MENIGVVKKVKDNEAVVEIQRSSACGDSCASCKGGCIPTRKYVDVLNIPQAKVGERVKIEIQTRKVLNAALVMYGIPLISLFIGVLFGVWISTPLGYKSYQEGFGIVMGLTFLVLSYLGIRLWDRAIKTKEKVEIVIVKVLD